MFNFAFALSILRSDDMYTILLISLVILLPFFFVQLLDVYVVIGRKMKIDDYDMYYLIEYFDPQYAREIFSTEWLKNYDKFVSTHKMESQSSKKMTSGVANKLAVTVGAT